MVQLNLGTLATMLALSASLAMALPTDKELALREPKFHGTKEADAQVAPLPHGWYGHDATAPHEHSVELLARDTATAAAANHDARSIITPKRDANLEKKDATNAINPVYEYDEHGYIVSVHPRDYPEGFEVHGNGKKAKRFSDAGAEPGMSWFPDVVRKALAPRKTTPIGCAEHNMKCRSLAEKRAMAEALSGVKTVKVKG